MAPIDPTNTAVYFLDYTVATKGHTLQMRCDPTVTDSDASATMAAFITAIESQLLELNVTGFRFRQAGQHVTLPAVWSADTTFGDGAGDPYQSAQYVDFVGRDSNGVRVRASMFGAILSQLGGDYRALASESSYVADGIAALTSDAQMFWTVGGDIPVWNNYADIGVNAYWRNRIR